jgi:uncharacterized protein YjiK
MRRIPLLVLGLALLLNAGCWRNRSASEATAFPEMELVAGYVLDMAVPIEPSGLVQFEETFYTVADKDDATIYRLEFKNESARILPAIQFDPGPLYGMDWEGLSVDPAGNFYLVSEEYARITKVTPDGQRLWTTPDVGEDLREVGLLAKSNAGFEGIAWLGPNHWLTAVEREPRGLVEFRRQGDEFTTEATLQDHSQFSTALPFLRLPDYSGLATDETRIFALFRNAHLIVRLERKNGVFEEVEAWSYRHLETDPRWAYRSQTYGKAEGLVVDGQNAYLIFDNNLGARQSDPNDGRPLFLHLRFPEPH